MNDMKHGEGTMYKVGTTWSGISVQKGIYSQDKI